MDQPEEESHDVDITILSEEEQPETSLPSSDYTLPHFQFLVGGGIGSGLQYTMDRPTEGFVALKMTFNHVFRKQREENRLLQQKYHQLATEFEEYKARSKESSYRTEITDTGPERFSDIRVGELPNLADHWLSEVPHVLLKALITLANCLLKREPVDSPLCDVLKKIVAVIQRKKCSPDELASMTEQIVMFEQINRYSPSAEAATNVQTWEILRRSGAEMQRNSEPRSDSSHASKPSGCQDNVETSPEEDMYGADKSLGDTVPYNLVRLFEKLASLQRLPAQFRSMVDQLSATIEQLQLGEAWNDNLPSSEAGAAVKSPPVGSATSAEGLPSIIHDIKLPPEDFCQFNGSASQENFTTATYTGMDHSIYTTAKSNIVCSPNYSLPVEVPSEYYPTFDDSWERFAGSVRGPPNYREVSQDSEDGSNFYEYEQTTGRPSEWPDCVL